MELTSAMCPRGHVGTSEVTMVAGSSKIMAEWENKVPTDYLEPQPFAPGMPIVGIYYCKCKQCGEEFELMELKNGDII